MSSGFPHDECLEKMKVLSVVEAYNADLEYDKNVELKSERNSENDVEDEDYKVPYALIEDILSLSAAFIP